MASPVTEWSSSSEFAGCDGHAFPVGRVPSNITASTLMDFDLIASEYARHRKIMLPVLDGLRDFVAGINRKGAVLELGSGTGNYIIALAQTKLCGLGHRLRQRHASPGSEPRQRSVVRSG